MQHEIKKGLLVILGGSLQGLGMGLFLFPQSIPSGGAGGITIIIHYLLNIPVGIALWIVNFSLIFLGITYLGKRFALWTFIGITITSMTVHFIENLILLPNRNLIIDIVFGSIFLGTGIGILMRQGVSNGGIGVIAILFAYRKDILPGKPLFYMNCFIFFVTAVIVNWKIIFFALISQWISAYMIDYVYTMRIYNSYTFGWRKKP
ncbi:YitT family protein [Virgibacillus soli]|uniref:YitT family protein n=2 Tax=Paracerasibacillus soli TaxID=480284 RepID=UPI0035E4F6BF